MWRVLNVLVICGSQVQKVQVSDAKMRITLNARYAWNMSLCNNLIIKLNTFVYVIFC